MIKPHIHIPYSKIYEYLDIIRQGKLNLEIYFDALSLDKITKKDIKNLNKALSYEPSLSFHAPFMDLSPGAVDPKIRNITIERFSQVFDIAEIMRPKAIVFHSGYEKWKYAFKVETWLEGSLITWQQLIKRAEKLNIKIAIENIFEDEPDSIRELMCKINSSMFGACFDTGHFNLFSKKTIEEWISSIGQFIVEFHLHDNNKNFDDHLPIGEGSFDFSKFFNLVGSNRDIIYTIEARSATDALKSIERLKELIN